MPNPIPCPAEDVGAIVGGRKTMDQLPPRRWFAFYWFRFDGLPVTFPALSTKHFRWTRLRGVQIGRWFFGAIKGGPGAPYVGSPSPRTDEQERTP